MPYHNYRKDLMGSAKITPQGSFEVGSWQSFKIEYKAGKFGIDDQGGIMIGMRPHFDGSKLQNKNPKKEGYVTVETSTNIPVDFKIETRRSIRPLNKNIYISCLRYLNENDKIIIRLGDKRFGSPGLRLQTFCEKKFDFKMLIDPFATQDFIPLPDEKNPEISIVPTDGISWKLIAPTHRRPNQKFNIFIKCEDKWGNPSNKVNKKLFLSSNELIEGLPKSVSFKKGSFSLTLRNLKIMKEDVYKITIKDDKNDILNISNPLIIKQSKYIHFWSDMHGQSRETIGTNTADEYFDFGKNKSFLDICGHQGNDFQITDEFWKQLNLLTKKYNEDGVFLAIPGYEWSGNTSVGGDHNVWYKKENRPIFRSSRALISDKTKKNNDAHTSKDLINKLIKEDALVVAHVGGRFADISYAHDAKLEPSVEIHSAWGTFDWILKDAFKLNYKVGIVGGSDGHKGRPGASFPGDSLFGSYGGLTCHLLEKLDRDNLFKEFRSRHHYATTGARIYLDVQGYFDKQTLLKSSSGKKLNIESCFMGDEVLTSSSMINLKLNIEGTAPIEKIEIHDGLKLIKVIRPYKNNSIKKRIRITCAGQNYRGRGRLVNWDCKAIFESGKITKFRGVNFWNPNRQPKKNNLNSIEWKTVTTGGSSCVDIWVSEETFSKNLFLENNFKNIKLNLKEIDKTPVQFDFGGMDIRLIIETLPIKLKQCHINETLPLKLVKNKEARIYVKVIQEDGHQAWSSPMYIKNK